jgi:hypothetical protein
MLICDDCLSVALFLSMRERKVVAGREVVEGQMVHALMKPVAKSITGNTVMSKVLKRLLGMISREHPAKKPTPITRPKRSNTAGDFRAVSIAPSLMCCAAAMHATERRYLLREAPRLPLGACTMPTHCSCKFRKNADRRDSDRRLLGATETNRWFAGLKTRRRGGRRLTEK